MTPSDENNLPQLPTFADNAMEQLRPYLLDPREDYPEPFYMLEFNGVPFSPLGGIQAISGQKKNGKSFVLTQIMAAILGYDTERVQLFLPGLTVPRRTIEHLGHEPTVLYCDTEMEKLNSAKVLRRVHWLCGWEMNQPNERLNVLWLRDIEDEKDEKGNVRVPAYVLRLRLIRLAIEVLSPDCVFIDGIRDIIGDFNDNAQSAALVGDLMSLATKRNICIWNALHLNPRPGNDDESKMRGHLGTELGNKVSDTLASYKKKASTGVTFTVKQQDARGKDLDDWQFEVTDDAGNLGIPKIIGNAKNISLEPEPDTEEDIIAWLNKAKETYNFPMTRRDVKAKVFGEIGGQKNSKRQQLDLTLAINRGHLVETAMKQNGYPMLDVAGDLPF